MPDHFQKRGRTRPHILRLTGCDESGHEPAAENAEATRQGSSNSDAGAMSLKIIDSLSRRIDVLARRLDLGDEPDRPRAA